jgi:hypothetical protein
VGVREGIQGVERVLEAGGSGDDGHGSSYQPLSAVRWMSANWS